MRIEVVLAIFMLAVSPFYHVDVECNAKRVYFFNYL